MILGFPQSKENATFAAPIQLRIVRLAATPHEIARGNHFRRSGLVQTLKCDADWMAPKDMNILTKRQGILSD